MTKTVENITSKQIKNTPSFSSGDTVVVSVKVKEGKRERIQAFEGVVVAIKNRGISSSFTVRKISYGEGVERVFQTHSPLIDSIKLNDAVMSEEPNYTISEKDQESQQE